MKWSMPLGRAFGVPIRMHISFLLLLLWIGWLGWNRDGLHSSLLALALILCLFGCVVLHELGHSLVALRFGAKVRSITLLPIGGVAMMKSIPEKPYQELLVAFAGPLVNVAIAAILTVLRGGFPPWGAADMFPSSLQELLDTITCANVVLAVFNLLPAFPMDGGRVLRGILAMFLPYATATTVAAGVGQVLSVGLILAGLMGNVLLMIIGVLVFLGAENEERLVRLKSLLRDVHVEDVMVTQFVRLLPDDPVGRCLEYVYHHRQEDFPVEQDGRLVGILARADWLAALHRDGAQAPVRNVMRQHFVSVRLRTPLTRLYQDLRALDQGVFPVVEKGQMLGLVTADDVSRYVLVQEARGTPAAAADGPRGAGPTSRLSIDLG